MSTFLPSRLRGLLLAAALVTAAPAAHAQRNAGPDHPADWLAPTFHKQRRELVRQALPAGSVAVVFAAPVRNRANDVDFVYHQNPDLYYLTGYDEPNSLLVLFKEPQTINGQAGITEMLFVQARNPQQEQWTGRRLGAEGARQQLGLQYTADGKTFAAAGIPWGSFRLVTFQGLLSGPQDDARDPNDLFDLLAAFRRQVGIPADYNATLASLHQTMVRYGAQGEQMRTYLTTLAANQPAVAADAFVQAYLKADSDAARKTVLASPPAPPRYNPEPLNEVLDSLRAIKTPEELALLRRAVRISAVGQQEVMKLTKPTMGEMELQGLHEYVYKKYGAEFEGYPSIVGAGSNACVLHYISNDKPQVKNDLLLMDCGAEYHGYSADVTRTIPPGGRFSPAQRQLYELVLAAQDAGIAACKPGADFQSPHKAAQQVLTDGLLKLGIIQKADDVRRYFPHGTSHYLGLDVHDRGTYGPLQAGNVITVEPGLYIPEGSPCDKKWWNIGVRIEDDVLITSAGAENLSREAPRTVADIEAMMARPSALEGFTLPELK